jgi:uncharacterized protein
MKRQLGILLLASSTAAVPAASFDCAKAHTPQEKIHNVLRNVLLEQSSRRPRTGSA